LLLASSASLRLRAAAVVRSHATLSATSLTFLHMQKDVFAPKRWNPGLRWPAESECQGLRRSHGACRGELDGCWPA
jgi:hypothetical protein